MRILTQSQTLRLLGNLFEMPAPRAQKCRTLFNLAKKVQRPNMILELGTFHGTGAIALWYGSLAGAHATIYTADAYTPRKGWASEPYGPEDQAIAVENFIRAGIIPNIDPFRPFLSMIKEDIQVLAETWSGPIGLLFWDLGVMSCVEKDLDAWYPYLAPGATIALHDTADGRLGAQSALTNRGLDFVILPGGVWTAEVFLE